MYIPKSKQKVNTPLNGGTLYDIYTGNVYIGVYVRDHLNNYYKGDSITDTSERLRYEPVEVISTAGISTFIHHYVTPTADDYIRGSFYRYFIKDTVTNLVKEVDQVTFLLEEKTNKPYRKTLQVEWYLTKKDVFRNKKTIENAEKILLYISQQVLKSPEQFVV